MLTEVDAPVTSYLNGYGTLRTCRSAVTVVQLSSMVPMCESSDNIRFQNQFNDIQYLTFESVTLVPFEPNLIDYDLLTFRQVSVRILRVL